MKMFILALSIMLSSATFALPPTALTASLQREKLMMMWLEHKYDLKSCGEEYDTEFKTHQNIAVLSGLDSIVKKNKECQQTLASAEGKFDLTCFRAIEFSDLGQALNKKAGEKCKVSSDYNSMESACDVDNSKDSEFKNEPGNRCKVKVKCNQGFSVRSHDQKKGTYIFHCEKGEDPNCPVLLKDCKISYLQKIGTFTNDEMQSVLDSPDQAK